MSRSELVASIAYHLTFTLFESAIAFIIVLVIGNVVSKRWTPEPFLTLSSVLLIEFSIMAIVFQHLVIEYASFRWMLVSCLAILVITFAVIPRIPKLQDITRIIAERLTVLTSFYIFFDIIAVVIIIIRNL